MLGRTISFFSHPNSKSDNIVGKTIYKGHFMQVLRVVLLGFVMTLFFEVHAKKVATATTVDALFDLVHPDKLTDKPIALVQENGVSSKLATLTNKTFLQLTGARFANSVVSTTDGKAQYDQEVKKTPKWLQKVKKIAALPVTDRMVKRELLMGRFRTILRRIQKESEGSELYFYQVYEAFQKLSIPEIFLIYSQPLLEKKSSDLYFGKEPNAGFGVATASNKHPGEFIGLYAGRLLKLTKKVTFGKDTEFLTFQLKQDVEYGRQMKGIKSFPRSPYFFKRVAISAARRRNLTALINDGKKPNVLAITVLTPEGWRTVLIAICHIKPHEKLSWSYGPGYWDDLEKKDLPGPLQPIDLESLN